MTSAAELLCAATRKLRAAGIEAARAEARLLLAHATGLPRERSLLEPHAPVEPEAAARFAELVAARARRVPIAHLLGEREFWSLPLVVNPDVLVPRPESETLIEAALRARPERDACARILDLGTGSGCLLVALLHEYPRAFGVGVDRSAAALAVALANLARHGLRDRASLVCADWATALSGPFDLVVANPPYVARDELALLEPEVARFEPRTALDGGPDGLDAHRLLIPELPRLLAASGVACLEIGCGQEVALEPLLAAQWLRVERVRDLAGIVRCLVVTRA